jgi:tripartite-type tricarboxylate transporter receptor subunit TctC
MLAPVATPKEAVARMNAEINRALQEPQLRATFVERGLEPIGGTPEKLGEHLKREIAKYAQIVKQANIKVD